MCSQIKVDTVCTTVCKAHQFWLVNISIVPHKIYDIVNEKFGLYLVRQWLSYAQYISELDSLKNTAGSQVLAFDLSV